MKFGELPIVGDGDNGSFPDLQQRSTDQWPAAEQSSGAMKASTGLYAGQRGASNPDMPPY
jgi:hypothetical protein